MKGLKFEMLVERHIMPILDIEKESQASAWSEQSFRNELGHKHGIFIVATKGDKVLGYAGAWILVDEAHITTLAVKPETRKQGLGKLLMEELLKRSVQQGATCSTLEVRVGNVAAITLYRKIGFVESGIRKDYYPDNKESALVMWLHDLDRFQT